MPLIKSGSREAVGTNISEMEAAGHPRAQAIAASLRNARQYGAHMASGGFTPPFAERTSARSMMQGFLHSSVPGRTDKLPISVSGGAYVVPSSHVAAIGQDNSLAGANILNRMFRMGPYGAPASPMHAAKAATPRLNLRAPAPPKATQPKFSKGGDEMGQGKETPIIAAGGEFVIPPEKIIERFGSLKKGHAALDKWIVDTRKKHAKTLQKLAPPKRN